MKCFFNLISSLSSPLLEVCMFILSTYYLYIPFRLTEICEQCFQHLVSSPFNIHTIFDNPFVVFVIMIYNLYFYNSKKNMIVFAFYEVKEKCSILELLKRLKQLQQETSYLNIIILTSACELHSEHVWSRWEGKESPLLFWHQQIMLISFLEVLVWHQQGDKERQMSRRKNQPMQKRQGKDTSEPKFSTWDLYT